MSHSSITFWLLPHNFPVTFNHPSSFLSSCLGIHRINQQQETRIIKAIGGSILRHPSRTSKVFHEVMLLQSLVIIRIRYEKAPVLVIYRLNNQPYGVKMHNNIKAIRGSILYDRIRFPNPCEKVTALVNNHITNSGSPSPTIQVVVDMFLRSLVVIRISCERAILLLNNRLINQYHNAIKYDPTPHPSRTTNGHIVDLSPRSTSQRSRCVSFAWFHTFEPLHVVPSHDVDITDSRYLMSTFSPFPPNPSWLDS